MQTFYLEVILFGFFWAKITRTPKNLPAPTPMGLTLARAPFCWRCFSLCANPRNKSYRPVDFNLFCTATQTRSVTKLDCARGKKQVWRPHVRTWGLSEANYCIEESNCDVF